MQYSISDLEQLSGVQAHTIRMWEQRYNALVPHRSAGNTRYYDDQHLVKLLNIVSINQKGLKISKICALSQEAIYDLLEQDIQQTVSKSQQFEYYISQLINFGMLYNEIDFNELLAKCINDNGLTKTYSGVIYPLLVRLGLMWRKDNICAAQEHFLTNIIRQKITVAIDNLPISKDVKNTWVLFLPEEEAHELGILFAHYLLRKADQRVIYLGNRIPINSLKEVIAVSPVKNIMFFMSHGKLIADAQLYVNQLAATFKEMKIYLSGSEKLIEKLKLPKNVNWLKNINDFEALISNKIC